MQFNYNRVNPGRADHGFGLRKNGIPSHYNNMVSGRYSNQQPGGTFEVRGILSIETLSMSH